MTNKHTVNIHGKEYETVASRVQRFREKYPDLTLATQIIDRDDTAVVIKASIINQEGRLIATGHAEEQRQASTINRTSALENAETSAIGRALASFGIGGTEFAAADEVASAITQQAKPAKAVAPAPPRKPAVAPSKADDRLVTEAQIKLLLARSRDASGLKDRQEIYDFFLDTFGKMPNEVKRNEVDAILARLHTDGGES